MSTLLGAVRKNDREEIRVQLAEYEGHRYIDIRAYFRPKPGAEWLPTKKGVTVPPRLLDSLIESLLKAKNGEREGT